MPTRMLILDYMLSVTFSFRDDKMYVDEVPFLVRAGEIEYQRLSRGQWKNRLQQAKAAGLNTVLLTGSWSEHELARGDFDFGGQNDISSIVKLAAEQDLYVVLRPGITLTNEFDYGGLPARLVGTSSEDVIGEALAWVDAVSAQIIPHMW